MKRMTAVIGCVAALGFASPAAQAADGYVSVSVSLRAGPDSDFPRVTRIRAGRPLVIYGCLERRDWCDVSYGGERGWVSAEYLNIYDRDRRPRRIYRERVAVVGLPLITFSFGSYWDSHYRSRDWYRDRDNWRHRHPRWDDRRGHDHHDRGRGRGRGHDRH